MASNDTQWPAVRSARRSNRARYALLPDVDLGVDRQLFDRLVRFGVPFHAVSEGAQEESPKPRSARRRLEKGQTLFLVQPHEYLPRLRRFLYLFARHAGLDGMQLRSFLFRVDVPGKDAMPEHDDGASELFWYQIAGERHAAFGDPSATPRDPTEADGRTDGRFEGALPAGSMLYLPPHTPHAVACRNPSIAVSAYWEPSGAFEEARDWYAFLEESHPAWDRLSSARLAEKAGRAWEGADGALFRALLRTRDGAVDDPPEATADLERPEQVFSAYRAFALVESASRATVAAGGDAVLEFPAGAREALKQLAHYGTATRRRLQAAGTLGARQLTTLLEVLIAEGLVMPGSLPAAGEFYADDLSGWAYSSSDESLQ